jgi:7,8-dihydroneopterin aldolase/epimerase/oxygenase
MGDWIRVRGIEFYGYHGVSAAEREVGHRYVVDVDLEADLLEAGKSDDLCQTLDYAEAIALVLQIGQGDAVLLMERLAQQIAEALLERFPPARSVRVAVSKRLPPVNAVALSAGVEITRTRAPG